jgi:hypothetical protein
MAAALATQFLPDGVHVERTPGYHHWMVQVVASYAQLARLFPEADAPSAQGVAPSYRRRSNAKPPRLSKTSVIGSGVTV